MNDLKFLEKNGVFSKMDNGKTTKEERIRKLTDGMHKMGELHVGECTTDFKVQEDTSRFAEWAKPKTR